MTPEFVAFPKLARLHRTVTITEKIDGTNACVIVTDDGLVYAQSRKRLITPQADNFGFAAWVDEHTPELQELGPGHHFGEWYGSGIQRNYGLDERRFALFNTDRWGDKRPKCCHVVPVLRRTTADNLNDAVRAALSNLRILGSAAVRGYKNPEGIVVFFHAANAGFKVTLENDETPKSAAA